MSEQFYNWLGQRIEDYEAARERGIKAFETRVARNAAALNGGIEPNVSSAGFHAPIAFISCTIDPIRLIPSIIATSSTWPCPDF